MTTQHVEVASPTLGQRRGATVRIQDLYKRYDTVTAIDGISLDVPSGEFLTLLGPSGSGKTTTLMTVAGFEVPTSGEVFINGQPMSMVPPHKRGIGMVFQSYALFPHMTIAENIAFPLRMRKMERGERERRVQEALTLVRLPQVAGRYPQQLSGGQQQRIALARALVYDPPLLLMDEPLGALDKQLREELQLEIKRLQNRLHITVLYVTHDQSEALVMSDRIAVFRDGRIEQIGTPQELYDAPANRFVASFLGESNFLDLRLVGREGTLLVGETRGGLPVRVPAADGAAPGAYVTIAVRPEKILFSGDLPNRLQVQVTEAIFEGEVWRYELTLPAGSRLVLKQTNRQGMKTYRPGETVTIGWETADGRIVHVEEGSWPRP